MVYCAVAKCLSTRTVYIVGACWGSELGQDAPTKYLAIAGKTVQTLLEFAVRGLTMFSASMCGSVRSTSSIAGWRMLRALAGGCGRAPTGWVFWARAVLLGRAVPRQALWGAGEGMVGVVLVAGLQGREKHDTKFKGSDEELSSLHDQHCMVWLHTAACPGQSRDACSRKYSKQQKPTLAQVRVVSMLHEGPRWEGARVG